MVVRQRLILTGVVQGVGFRPNVARIAARWPITGLCGNDDFSVFIEAQGEWETVRDFFEEVRAHPPPLARIVGARLENQEIIPEIGFRITTSRRSSGAVTLLPADTAICGDCLADIADDTNRRYQYPFTTCTNCGPRYSIIFDVPYDRPLTTMADFPMCEACAHEYHDPTDRRFHAQPISCFDCGPVLWLEEPHDCGAGESGPQRTASTGARRAEFAAVIAEARSRLMAGQILAVKGIGGFTLMCDASNQRAVARLRRRKRRPHKPLALMAGSLTAANQLAHLTPGAEEVLLSPAAPIVLAPMSLAAATYLAPAVAPNLDDVGVMLPYTPLHRLLLGAADVLVATSANSSALPLTYRDPDARQDLGHIVDAFLMHDRAIHSPIEDSVVQADTQVVRPVRRSRGYAPLPVELGAGEACVLAVGAELKNTFALTRDGLAFMSAHIGDLGSLETQAAYEQAVALLMRAHRRVPELVVVDKHPGYASRRWGHSFAERSGIEVFEIQHHHAHALSLVAEHRLLDEDRRLSPPLVAVVLDGTGYGEDGTIWGGEVLRLGPNPLEVSRAWHLPGFWLPGGDSAIRHPWKSALGLLSEYGLRLPSGVWEGAVPGASRWGSADGPSPDELALVASQIRAQVAVVRTSSAGRLFDAVASLLGVCQLATYEGQPAMELERVARQCPHRNHDPIPSLRELVEFLISGLADARSVACLAWVFHASLAATIADAVEAVAVGTELVGLTGGVFANRILTGRLVSDFAERGLGVLQHSVVPCNDGGLALGQALAGVLHVGGLESGAD